MARKPQIKVNIGEDAKDALEARAARRGKSVSAHILTLIKADLGRTDRDRVLRLVLAEERAASALERLARSISRGDRAFTDQLEILDALARIEAIFAARDADRFGGLS